MMITVCPILLYALFIAKYAKNVIQPRKSIRINMFSYDSFKLELLRILTIYAP